MAAIGITDQIFPPAVDRQEHAVFQNGPIEIVLKEHSAALARREAARLAFVEADADAMALTEVICKQGSIGTPGSSLDYDVNWLRAAERASESSFKSLLPVISPPQYAEAHGRWAVFVANARRLDTVSAA